MTTIDGIIEASVRAQVVEGLAEKLEQLYVFPEMGRELAALLREKLAEGLFDTLDSGEAFGKRLTEELQGPSRDLHLNVYYDANPQTPGPVVTDDEAKRALFMKRLGELNYGFHKIERLSGNIGYLDLRSFHPVEVAGDHAAAAMQLLNATSALIIDVRHNRGGAPNMVQLLLSYLVPEGQHLHLNSLYFRPTDSTEHYYTLPYVPGKRYTNKPVYVLTSGETFSAAEEFSYNVKTNKLGTLIGETTKGGAHPGDFFQLHDNFRVFIPAGRAINPVTLTNWEGTGVHPDIAMPADQALEEAMRLALEHIQMNINGQYSELLVEEATRALKGEGVELRVMSLG